MGNIFSIRKCWIPTCNFKGLKEYNYRCQLHQHANICQVPNCNCLTYDMNLYCVDHTCGVNDCSNKMFKSGYCFSHFHNNTCQIDKCPNIPLSVDNKSINLCIEHRCNYQNCTNHRLIPLYFCHQHQCQINGCRSSVYGNYSYCFYHYNQFIMYRDGLVECYSGKNKIDFSSNHSRINDEPDYNLITYIY